MPLSAVVTSSTTSATNNNTKYSSTSFGGRLTPPSVFDNQLTHNEDDLSAKYDLDKVNDIFKLREFVKKKVQVNHVVAIKQEKGLKCAFYKCS